MPISCSSLATPLTSTRALAQDSCSSLLLSGEVSEQAGNSDMVLLSFTHMLLLHSDLSLQNNAQSLLPSSILRFNFLHHHRVFLFFLENWGRHCIKGNSEYSRASQTKHPLADFSFSSSQQLALRWRRAAKRTRSPIAGPAMSDPHHDRRKRVVDNIGKQYTCPILNKCLSRFLKVQKTAGTL